MKKSSFLEGQLSFWDVPVIPVKEKPKIEVKQVTVKKEDLKELTPEQLQAYHEYAAKGNITRIAIYCLSSLAIELKQNEEYTTIVVSKDGETMCGYSGRMSLLPLDKIIYFTEKTSFNKIQNDKIQELLCKNRDSVKRIIKRNGDYNVNIELKNKFISINQLGWTTEYESIKTMECSEDEVFMKLEPIEAKKELDPYSIKVGDFVQAMYKERVIEGVISRAYDTNALNIIFDNRTKHTAIHRLSVIKILQSAEG
jgi:hypothetical protein